MLQQFPLVLFFIRNRRFLGFGLFLSFCASFGQTYYIALFNGVLNEDLGLSSSQLGTYYGIATFVSAVLLINIGKLIDVWDLRLFTAFTFVILAAACLMFANATTPLMLILAMVGLRLGGQGLMPHTGMTSMSRYFDQGRGRAVSICMMGSAAGVAVFPALGAIFIATIEWRYIWIGSAVVLLCLGLPFTLYLLRGHGRRHQVYLARQEAAAEDGTLGIKASGWTRGQALRDKRFYLLMPLMLALPFIATGIQFHQVTLVEEKGWSLAMFASGYAVSAIFTVFGGISVGNLIARIGVARLVPWFNAPLCVSLTLLVAFDTPYIIWVYMIANGLGGGIYGVLQSVLWPELYGTKHLGAIRSLVMSMSVFAAALAPAVVGWLLDLGWTIQLFATASLVYLVAVMAMATRIKISAVPPPQT